MAYCRKCGAYLEGGKFCPQCGAPIKNNTVFLAGCDSQKADACGIGKNSGEPVIETGKAIGQDQKKSSGSRKNRHPFLKFVLILLGTVCLIFIFLNSILYTLINGPFPAARELLAVSIQENDTVGYLMKLLLTDEEIMEIEQEQNQTVFEPVDLPEVECAHIWKKATCTVPPICEICGTAGKSALGHDWVEATYESPKTCLRCGQTEGMALGKVGDIIEFGYYEQDNNRVNGAEPLQWQILDINGNDLLVISRYAIDCRPYNSENVDTTWETCSLRKWLNEQFYYGAFDENEQMRILTSFVTADENSAYHTNAGADTQDKIYLLSLPEVEHYLPKVDQRICSSTAYSISRGAYVNPDTDGSWWWLRTPGSSSSDAASINSDGSIDCGDGTVNSAKGVVRPVMWISMDSAGQ